MAMTNKRRAGLARRVVMEASLHRVLPQPSIERLESDIIRALAEVEIATWRDVRRSYANLSASVQVTCNRALRAARKEIRIHKATRGSKFVHTVLGMK